MKTIARYAWVILALGAGLLFSSGTMLLAAQTRHTEPVYDLIVVQSSIDRKLTPADLDQLHEAVARFLASQGPIRSGEYIIRVDFPPERPGAAAEWMIVKLTNLPPPTFSQVDDYPPVETGYDYRYDYGYAYSPYGYYDPFGLYFDNYYWPSRTIPFQPGRHGPGAHRPGDTDDHPRGTQARNDSQPGEHRPGYRNDRPRVTYTRVGDQPGAHRPGDKDGCSRDTHPRNEAQSDHEHRIRTAENTPHSSDSGRWRDTGSTGRSAPLSSERTGGTSFTPPPAHARTETPPPASNSQRDKDNGARKQEQ